MRRCPCIGALSAMVGLSYAGPGSGCHSRCGSRRRLPFCEPTRIRRGISPGTEHGPSLLASITGPATPRLSSSTSRATLRRGTSTLHGYTVFRPSPKRSSVDLPAAARRCLCSGMRCPGRYSHSERSRCASPRAVLYGRTSLRGRLPRTLVSLATSAAATGRI